MVSPARRPKRSKKATRAQAGSSVWDDPVEVQRTDMPDARKKLRKQTAMKTMVWANLVTWPILALTAASLALNGPGTTTKTAAVSTQAFSPSRGVASSVIDSWLAQNPSPLPGGRVLSLDQVARQPVNAAAKDPANTPNVDVVTFTVTDNRGNLYRSAVSVEVRPDGSTVVLSSPSLVPYSALASTSQDNSDPWPGCPSGTVTEATRGAIAQWANAYASGDSDKLRLAVGDTNGTHLYTPMPPAQSVETSASAACVITKANSDRPGEQVLAVRARIKFVWAGTQNPSQLPGTDLDVRVERSDTAAPVITAWGDPGTGPSLTQYANAEVSSLLKPNDKDPVSATPTPSSTPSSTASATPSTTPKKK